MRNGRHPKIPLVVGVQYKRYGEYFDDAERIVLTAAADWATEKRARERLLLAAKLGDAEAIRELQRRYRCRVEVP